MADDLTSTVAEARKDFGELLSRAHYQNERIRVTKRDKPFARLISEKDGTRLDRLDQEAERHGVTPDEALVRSVEDQSRLDKIERLAARLGVTTDELIARYESAVLSEQEHSNTCNLHENEAL